MTERAALIAAIICDRADDTPRLVFADWLDEHGEHERAEFIRADCQLVRFQCEGCRCESRINPLCRYSEAKELSGRWKQLFAKTPLWFEMGAQETEWCRGFVSGLVWNWDSWRTHADAIAWHPYQLRECPETAQPIERVTLTTAPDPTYLRKRLRKMLDGVEKEERIGDDYIKGRPFEGRPFDRERRRMNYWGDSYQFYQLRLLAACWPGIELTIQPTVGQTDFDRITGQCMIPEIIRSFEQDLTIRFALPREYLLPQVTRGRFIISGDTV